MSKCLTLICFEIVSKGTLNEELIKNDRHVHKDEH